MEQTTLNRLRLKAKPCSRIAAKEYSEPYLLNKRLQEQVISKQLIKAI